MKTYSLGISEVMRNIEAMLPRLAQHAATILITGESGVGKEHIAHRLHLSDPHKANRPFVAVNCGALTESLLEAELFGYEKGAFTGALRTKKGVFEQAHGGTLFLDEIGEMPPIMQVKLLRAIEERRIVRVGGETSIPIELRLICATHRDLKKMVKQGLFREDLFYRINVIHLKIPPLRERKEDILWFAHMFLQQYAEQHQEEKKSLHCSAEQALLDYDWPGNIRELKHNLEGACIMTTQPILFSADIFNEEKGCCPQTSLPSLNLEQHLQICEREYILRALEKHQWHISKTATSLNISRKNLWEKMKKLNIPGKSLRTFSLS